MAINLILFLIAYRLRSDKLTDISYAVSFLVIDLIGLLYAPELTVFSWLIFAMVAAWAVRIGSFLLVRVLVVGKDRRFDALRNSFVRFGKFWLGQALTAWALMLPVVLAMYNGGEITILCMAGLLIWAVGLVVEAAADYQKFAFKQDPANKGRWIQTGLWRYARHPNYFGEITVWAGVYVACFTALDGIEKLIGLGSPLLIALVLLYVSGVPILEKSADERWGKLKEYQAYKRGTRLIIPWPKSRVHAR